MKIEIQKNSSKTGFWIYLVNSNKKQFMLKYIKFSGVEGWDENLIRIETELAEKLIEFIKTD